MKGREELQLNETGQRRVGRGETYLGVDEMKNKSRVN